MNDSRSNAFPMPFDPLMMAMVAKAFADVAKEKSKKPEPATDKTASPADDLISMVKRIFDECEPKCGCSCADKHDDENPVSPAPSAKADADTDTPAVNLVKVGEPVAKKAKEISQLLKTIFDLTGVFAFVCDFEQVVATPTDEPCFPLGAKISEKQIIHMLEREELKRGETIQPIKGDNFYTVVGDSPIAYDGIPQGAVLILDTIPEGIDPEYLALCIEGIISKAIL